MKKLVFPLILALATAACTMPPGAHSGGSSSYHGGSSGGGSDNSHSGKTADEVAEELDLPEGSVETIDPGTPVEHDGVQDANDNGTSDDEADDVTAEGATQESTQPEEADPGEESTNGGNQGVNIF